MVVNLSLVYSILGNDAYMLRRMIYHIGVGGRVRIVGVPNVIIIAAAFYCMKNARPADSFSFQKKFGGKLEAVIHPIRPLFKLCVNRFAPVEASLTLSFRILSVISEKI